MPIKHHKTKIDNAGTFREYLVAQNGESYDFICVEWDAGKNGINHGNQKIRSTFKNREDAIVEYEKFLAAWESES